MKKLICLFLTVLLFSVPALAGALYSDVPETMWCHDEVGKMHELGLMLGTGGDKFSPDKPVTRGMAATVLYRYAGAPACEIVGSARYSDVRTGSYCDAAIGWAAEKGIVFGYADHSFRPDAPVSRQQLMTMLYRCAKTIGQPPVINTRIGHIADEAEGIAAYAREPMLWAEDNGILFGVSRDDLAPQNNATRAQLAAFMTRFISEQSRPRISFYLMLDDGTEIKGMELLSEANAERFCEILRSMDRAEGEYPEFVPATELRIGSLTYGFRLSFPSAFYDEGVPIGLGSSIELDSVRYYDSSDGSFGILTSENEELMDELEGLLLVEWMFFTAN